MDSVEQSFRVLSIQSHMVSGYCGNKAATFPLQTLGFDVDTLNTVQFSNHTGYPSWTGTRLTAKDVQDLFDGLERNGLTDNYTHVLTGYIGNFAILEKIEIMVQKLKSKNPRLVFVCDPVMGDAGQLYVAPEIVPLYRQIMKVADVITPNQFEAETLSGIQIDSLARAREVASALHVLGAPNVIITSTVLPPADIPSEIHLTDTASDSLYCLTSHIQKNGKTEQHLISFPTYQGYFTGTGDMFSALVVARLQEAVDNQSSSPLADAALKVVSTVNAVTKKTWLYQRQWVPIESHGEADLIESKPNAAELVRQCELLVVKGKKEIENPALVGEGIVKIVKLQ
ncbi:hypothetical protein DFQ28_003098 [Apophysomyces sp. BC1034]|nr:hypothetical protein DFQ30_009981 [Apophysomyces sp. BC1015]KAG0183169.1 hypothetical protein DFQ29_009245 [Apophysomyces sp. BC1021]KAG0189670.1 hypothetical protein DFQ28_003098 [Apophysomyces sp. BC1034]